MPFTPTTPPPGLTEVGDSVGAVEGLPVGCADGAWVGFWERGAGKSS